MSSAPSSALKHDGGIGDHKSSQISTLNPVPSIMAKTGFGAKGILYSSSKPKTLDDIDVPGIFSPGANHRFS